VFFRVLLVGLVFLGQVQQELQKFSPICVLALTTSIITLVRYIAVSKVLFIKCWNELRVFIRLNSVTKYLNSPYLVRNAVSHLSPFIIWRRLNAWIKSSFI